MAAEEAEEDAAFLGEDEYDVDEEWETRAAEEADYLGQMVDDAYRTLQGLYDDMQLEERRPEFERYSFRGEEELEAMREAADVDALGEELEAAEEALEAVEALLQGAQDCVGDARAAIRLLARLRRECSPHLHGSFDAADDTVRAVYVLVDGSEDGDAVDYVYDVAEAAVAVPAFGTASFEDQLRAHTAALAGRAHRMLLAEPALAAVAEDTEALAQIRTEQRRTDDCIDPVAFRRLVAEITQDFRSDMRWTPEALQALQAGTEDYLVGLFEDTQVEALHGQRQTIEPDDMQCSRRVRGERA